MNFMSRLWFGFHDFCLQREKNELCPNVVQYRYKQIDLILFFPPSTQYYLLCKEQNKTWHARACQSDWLTINKNRAIKSKKKEKQEKERNYNIAAQQDST